MKLYHFCFALFVAWLLAGCARVTIEQHETSADGTTRDTTFNARTFFDSRNELARTRTTMTEKSQGVTVAGLDQESSGTNAAALLDTVVRAAVTAAVKSAVP